MSTCSVANTTREEWTSYGVNRVAVRIASEEAVPRAASWDDEHYDWGDDAEWAALDVATRRRPI